MQAISSVSKKIMQARAGLVLDAPFFGSLALRLQLYEDPTCETVWTDSITMGFNPEFVDGLTLDEAKGIVAHEVSHCMFGHHTRRAGRDLQKWNKATDYVVNIELLDAGFVLPQGALFHDGYRGMSTDKVYRLLPDPPPSQEKEQGPGQKNDPGGCGEIRDYKPPSQDEPGSDQEPSPAQLAQSEQDWKVAVAQARQIAKGMGKMPAGIDRLVGEIIDPRVDWKTILRRFIEVSARNDYSWSMPNRRYIQQGIYLPQLHSKELKPPVLVCDTSGSRDDVALKASAAEISAILEDYDTTLYVVYCDTQINGTEVFTTQDLPLDLHPKGGGGTDFRPPFEWVRERGIDPGCLIYLTDLECSRFPEDPGYPVLWGYMGKYGETPPFGEVIHIE